MRVGALPREAHFVGDDHHGHAFAGKIAHHQQYFADELWVQRACRLVKKQKFWTHRKGTRDGSLQKAGHLFATQEAVLGPKRRLVPKPTLVANG